MIGSSPSVRIASISSRSFIDPIAAVKAEPDLPATMIEVRRASDRGTTRLDWLLSRHTFSFGSYHDPLHAGFGPLRVLNDDVVQPSSGFGPHSHRDMEILSWVVSGALEHRDSEGNGSVLRPGDLQRMSAGSGIRHSEWNHSEDEPVRFLQIWIEPGRRGLAPEYEERSFAPSDLADRLLLLADADGSDGSLRIRQDVRVLAGRLSTGAVVTHETSRGRRVWVQVVRGAVRLEGSELDEGDGARVEREAKVRIEGATPAEVLP